MTVRTSVRPADALVALLGGRGGRQTCRDRASADSQAAHCGKNSTSASLSFLGQALVDLASLIYALELEGRFPRLDELLARRFGYGPGRGPAELTPRAGAAAAPVTEPSRSPARPLMPLMSRWRRIWRRRAALGRLLAGLYVDPSRSDRRGTAPPHTRPVDPGPDSRSAMLDLTQAPPATRRPIVIAASLRQGQIALERAGINPHNSRAYVTILSALHAPLDHVRGCRPADTPLINALPADFEPTRSLAATMRYLELAGFDLEAARLEPGGVAC